VSYRDSRRDASQARTGRARQLRRQQTPAERRLWFLLRNGRAGGVLFRRQHAVGPYVLDFFCPAAALAIEVDGDSHFTPEGVASDRRRDAFLGRLGILVLHFDNTEVFAHPELVLGQILDAAGRWARAATR
jgi:very-short-patch-repair endonuclease